MRKRDRNVVSSLKDNLNQQVKAVFDLVATAPAMSGLPHHHAMKYRSSSATDIAKDVAANAGRDQRFNVQRGLTLCGEFWGSCPAWSPWAFHHHSVFTFGVAVRRHHLTFCG